MTPDSADSCYDGSHYLHSAYDDQPGPPTAPAYTTGTNGWGGTGWGDYDARVGGPAECYSGCGITVTAGGR